MSSEIEQVREWLEAHVNSTVYPCHDEFKFMINLLHRHPSFSTWKNQEVSAFRITRSIQKKGIQVEILVQLENKQMWRLVSWKSCVSGEYKEPDNMKMLTSAMRYSIRRQISIFRRNNPAKKCAICGVMANLEVDHDTNHKSFKVLRDEFIEKNPNVPTNFDFVKYNYRFKKSDKAYKRRWQVFHNTNAQYRYLCSTCNKKFK
jgi:hypothetical protein